MVAITSSHRTSHEWLHLTFIFITRLTINTNINNAMPDDYAGSGGGALRLKGAKVTKKKKKRDKTLEKKAASVATVEKPEDNDEDDAGPADRKTEAERRHEETRKKRVRSPSLWRLDDVLMMVDAADGKGVGGQARVAQDAQGEGRGVEYVSFKVERASRYAQDRAGLRMGLGYGAFWIP